MLRYDEYSRKQYEKVIGSGGIEAIRIAQDTPAELGIKLQARPSLQEKIDLLKAAEIAMQPGRDGIRGITYDDYTYVVERLHAGGNIKEIRLYLNQARKRAERKSFKEKQALLQQQLQGNRQQSQDRIKMAALEQNMKVRGQIAVDNNKAANDLRLRITDINGKYISQLENLAAKEGETAG